MYSCTIMHASSDTGKRTAQWPVKTEIVVADEGGSVVGSATGSAVELSAWASAIPACSELDPPAGSPSSMMLLANQAAPHVAVRRAL